MSDSTLFPRRDFLKNVWTPYPAIRFTVRDCRETERLRAQGLNEDLWVAGRLRVQGGRWFLASAGASLEVRPAVRIKWQKTRLASEGDLASDLEPAKILGDGDLVCVHLKAGQLALSLPEAHEVQLLAPAGNEEYALDFPYHRSEQWQGFMARIRSFFEHQDFVELGTPTLVPSPGTEPFLDPFATVWEMGRRRKQLYLPTSPEFHLKKALVAGWTRVFEFKTCFRNGEVSEHHQPEFLMLEWYRAYSNLEAIAGDVENLLRTLSLAFAWAPGAAAFAGVRTVTMADLFVQELGFRLEPGTTRDQLEALAKGIGVETSPDDSFDDLFFRLFLEKIEPGLGHPQPVIVKNYPPSQAALARIGAHGWAERFELYWKGLEIANAFHELNDPEENAKRFQKDNEVKRALGKAPVAIDDELLKALRYGLPPSGGIALGVDRLFMALFGLGKIEESRAFPFQAP